MSEKKFGKRLLAWALTMVLTVSLLPLSALAGEADSEEYEAGSYDYDLEQLDTDYYSLDGGQINRQAIGQSKNISISKGTAGHCTVYYVEGPAGLSDFKNSSKLPDFPVFSDTISHTGITSSYGILFFVKPDDGYALTNINGSGSVFNSIVDNDDPTKCDFWLNGNRGNLHKAGFTDDLIEKLVEKAKAEGCVAAFLYTRGENDDGITATLNFHTEPLAKLTKEIVSINGNENWENLKVSVGDKIVYRLTVTYYSSSANPVEYSDIHVTDTLVGYDSHNYPSDFQGNGDSETRTVEYTVAEKDIKESGGVARIVNTADLTYKYKATFNSDGGSSRGTSEAVVEISKDVTYSYAPDSVIPDGALGQLPASRTYTFRESVTVEDKPFVVGYTFDGWHTSDVDVRDNQFEMPKYGVRFVGSWTANTDTQYTVEHYKQNLDGKYGETADEVEYPTGTTGEYTNAAAKDYTGFNAPIVTQERIKGDGSTVIKIYYERERYTVTWKDADGKNLKSVQRPYGYAATSLYDDAPESPSKTDDAQYNYEFKGWDPSPYTNVVSDQTYVATYNRTPKTYTVRYTYAAGSPVNVSECPADEVHVFDSEVRVAEDASAQGYTFDGWYLDGHPVASTFKMPAKNITLEGRFSPAVGTAYTVKHLLQNLDGTYALDVSETKYGTTGTSTNAEAKSYTGYTAQRVVQAVIAADGSTVVEIKYDRNQYTVTWKNEDGTVLKTDTLRYGDMPSYTGEVPTKEDSDLYTYTFKGWTPEIVMVTDNAVYTAAYEENTKTPENPGNGENPENPDNGGNNGGGDSGDTETPSNPDNSGGDNGGSEAPTTPTMPSRPSRPSRPSSSTDNTVTIEDDDALGLNTTDHFAYIVGYGNGEVRPQNNITRAEVATIFFRLLTDDVRDENLTKTNPYSDVAATAWYNTAVSTLSSMGIITGYPDGTFRPNAAITRAEFAAIAARFDPNGDKTAASFSDIASHWAKDEISIAYNNGWINGYPDGTFGPQRDITRAETMTLVNRVLNRLPETEDDLLPNMTVWTDNANPKAWYYLAVQEATNSHYYEFKTNSQYEKWTELRETRDWSQLEK